MKYMCTEGFAVEKFDDDGFSTEKWTTVEEGEIWTVEDTTFRLVGGSDTVRLFRQKGKREWWLELTKESIVKYFKEVDDSVEEKTPIREICEQYGLTQASLGQRFGIPLRTVEQWCTGRRQAPNYVVSMIQTILDQEKKGD